MGYYLLDHPNPHHDADSPHWYTSRQRPVKAIVVHCTAGLQDLDLAGVDQSAEGTARYAATTTRQVSWHTGSDSDSFLPLLPATFTAFHCIGYNSSTIGHEISKRDMSWRDEPAAWVSATLERAAAGLRPLAAAYGVPLRHATRAELDRAIAYNAAPVGFIGHRELDPDRRDDPGADFPWTRFLDLMADTKEWDEMATKAEIAAVIDARVDQLQAAIPGMVSAALAAQRDEIALEVWRYRNAAAAKAAAEAGQPYPDMHQRVLNIEAATGEGTS